MEIKKVEKGTNTRDYDGECKSEEGELSEEEEEDKKDKKQEEQENERKCLDWSWSWSGWIPKRLIYSIVAGVSFILVLVIAVGISKHVGKNSASTSGDTLCPSGLPGCPKGWVRAFHKCYFLSEDQDSWKESQKSCGTLGANLAIFKSLEEMEFLKKRIGSTYYWLGLTNDMGRSWTWADGTLPSSWILIKGAGCAHLSQRGISSDSCKSSRNFMCIKEDRCA